MSLSSTISNLFVRGRGEILETVEGGLQAVGGRLLDEIGERTVREAVLPLLFQGDDLDRYVTRDGIELELIEHRPAEHVGQEDIERDGGGLVLTGERKRRRSAGTDDALETLVPRQTEQDARVVHVVLDDQEDGVAIRDNVPIVLDRLFSRHGKNHEFASHGRPDGCPFRNRDLRVLTARELDGKEQGKRTSLGRTRSRALFRRRASAASSRLMARPRPVPPYRRDVPASACWKASKMRRCFSGAMPMPVSSTAKATTLSALLSTG